MAAGRLQSSEHLSSLNSLPYKENNCIELITMWNTVGREESQSKMESEVKSWKKDYSIY